ncbi:GRAS FAMILY TRANSCRIPTION REGULATOR [Salix viminalis]|uniref:GRAS FAMILY TRANSCRIPTION REGULATOR n=1 Tax=Salix viminalis TaxID=40686 RepID=A0A9Q0SG48_SALVM|nr:GRAS FAMILY TRANSCRIPTION REGULATOR [Salix viminalis]
MPLPFESFQGKGVLDFASSTTSSPDSLHQYRHQWQNNSSKESCGFFVGSTEPTSVLDTISRQSPPTSSSTLSYSQGGGGASTDTTNGVAAAGGSNPCVDEKCGQQLGMEDWESVLPGSPSQEQSILRLIMGDIEDPSTGLNKLLQSGSRSLDMEHGSGFGVVDQVFGFDISHMSSASANLVANNNSIDPSSIHGINLLPGLFQQQQQQAAFDQDEKPQILNPGMISNQNQHQFVQNPATLFAVLIFTITRAS